MNKINLITASLSLITGFAFGLLPFLLWRLILPALLNPKKYGLRNKIVLNILLAIKFVILGVLLYFLINLSWINIHIFIIGLVIAPIFIIAYVLTKEHILKNSLRNK